MRKIRNNLYIGDLLDSREKELNDFDLVINVSSNNTENTTHHYPLYDGEPIDKENQEKNFRNAVKKIIESYDKKILVHCAIGKSRSPTVVATALSEIDGSNFDELVEKLGNPHPYLKEMGKRFNQ
jgi:protein-tyrosine phosphatase